MMTKTSANQQVVWAIIPARYESQRFRGKPLVPLLGKPMIQHVVERTTQANVANVWVATDDQRIYDAVLAFGGQAVMTKKSHTCGTDRIAEALTILTNTHPAPQWVLNVQGDEPLISPEDLHTLIEGSLQNPDAQLGSLVYPLQNRAELHNPHVVKAVLDAKNRALYFSRAPIPYRRQPHPKGQNHWGWRHLGVYLYKTSFLQTYQTLPQTPLATQETLEQLRVLEHGYPIHCFEAKTFGVGVDTPEDVVIAEALLQPA